MAVESFASLFSRMKDLIAPPLAEDWPNLPVRKAEGPYFYGVDGRRYLDFVSGMATVNLGHNHPKVVAAAKAQLDQLIHGPVGVVAYEPLLRLAEELTKILPSGLDMFFFANSGAEAVEGAVKLARYVTGRPGIIAFRGGFHGRTMGVVSLTTSKGKYRLHYEPLLPSVYFAPFPNPYRCPLGGGEEAASEYALQELEAIFTYEIAPEEVAAMVVEPVLGEGGYIIPPRRWLKALREICDAHDILLIFDEVQTGFGRTGEWFAAQTFGVTPDIMAIAKGIANGFPLSVVAAPKDLMRRWGPFSHGTTFGGNPVSCAAALATIEAMREEEVLENARLQGAYVLERLGRLVKEVPVVGDVRGVGLMIGIELVQPNETKAPNPEAAKRILKRALEGGLVLYPCGVANHVIRVIPPLNISREILDGGLSILERAVYEEVSNQA
ncbi:MAG: aspartate aminotransferase family protein [Armatimonadota bacterium]|nr:aspartate aminotransferase family protein [Armatimonadota bacterium]